MLSPFETSQYLKFAIGYKIGNRYQPDTADFFVIKSLENKEPRQTTNLRETNGLNVPSLTYIEPLPTGTPKPEGETTPRGENIFSFSTSTQPKTNIGLPPGTTPIDSRTGTETTLTTNETFLSKYKMPLLIGGAALLGYMLFKKK